ncbi:MAG TPA: Bax inhibitor-1/YccA family protein [Flavisolibacter sp.]|nr:Bax inhibitor-1/YccA family protein [Flavisolibacter sp.]
MGIFKGGNPAISEKTFDQVYQQDGELMTVRGTMNKFGVMLLMVIGAASFTWSIFFKQGPEAVTPWMWGGMIGGLVLAIAIIFKKTWAPYLALGYALCQGLFLGAISAFYDFAFAETYPSIIMHAVLLTMGTAAAMYFFYQTGIIKATNTFKKVVMVATAGIGIFYLIAIVMRMFGMQMPYLHDNGAIGIGISVFIVVIAALNLVLDFDMIDQGSKNGAPKYFEWYGAFGLMVTIVWLYLEMLRLLSKLTSRD